MLPWPSSTAAISGPPSPTPTSLALLTWGITDRSTWLNHEGARKDGLPERSLPFDADLKPKPAFFAELNALQQAPHR